MCRLRLTGGLNSTSLILVSTATHLPTTTTAARYSRVGHFTVYADGSGAPGHLFCQGFLFAFDFIKGEARTYGKNGSRRVPAKVLRMVHADVDALMSANLTDEWRALNVAMYAD